MLRSLTWAWKGLLPPVAPLSMRSTSSEANRRGKLDNKVAVITGSTKGSLDDGLYQPSGELIKCISEDPIGIGFAIARRLAQDGAHVVVSSRRQQNVDQAVAALQGEGLSVTGTVCHVGKPEDRERLVATTLESYGGVDFLVCVPAVNPIVGSTTDCSEQIWDKILNVNVKAPGLLLSQLLPHMEKRGQSSVVLVSSVAAYTPVAKLGVYNVSKTALLGLTKTLAVELAPKNIRVNCLVPGLIKTDFSKVLTEEPVISETSLEFFGVQRLGEPEDCAGIVSFLCSPDASYITGECIVVAGHSPHL